MISFGKSFVYHFQFGSYLYLQSPTLESLQWQKNVFYFQHSLQTPKKYALYNFKDRISSNLKFFHYLQPSAYFSFMYIFVDLFHA